MSIAIETQRERAFRIFREAGGRAIAEVDGPNGSTLTFYSFGGGGVVILQIYAKSYGWEHFIQSKCVSINDAIAELKALDQQRT